ncbi:T-protein [Candidatus Westeberhardia cardiocondylae]|uniref:T-protein n=1 Tax=Candidatus Westeberhardia cardiocondylae TaxID=1594731 RepID=A0A0H5BX50_9ENTR|nr:bifunctional chorismate mutase/prephenate dehydrogenase [Candidatus Westeberhardia cardiocondylae]MCR3756287.1 fused chorismate mutase/prephenate dehydrogenase [Candidatus Westeberhardia cardiocondylae]CEN32278.1 T-protein [Candidatus Westeberhardia cardiocondylae]
MQKNINKLRKKIDEIDQNLLLLIIQRLSISSKIGEIKKKLGIPIYDQKREKQLIKKKKNDANILKTSPDLIENILRCIINESYKHETNIGFKKIQKNINKIVIIGGNGKMGLLFEKMLSLSGYTVLLLGRKDWKNIEILLKHVNLVIISVPIHSTIKIIKKLPTLPKDCILMDLTSIKYEPIQTMLSSHTGPVLGMHPIFGPDISTFVKQTIVYCNGRYPESYQWILDQIKIWGANLQCMKPIEHDKIMSYIQSLRQFIHFIYGIFLKEKKQDIKKLIMFSTPIYRTELIMVMRLFSQNPELCYDIITNSKHNFSLFESYEKYIKKTINLIKSCKNQEFLKIFTETKDWITKHSDDFMLENKTLIYNIKNKI